MENAPDLGLLMYGLNDEAAWYPPEAYIEQYAFIAEHLSAECQADLIFMQPTPHIDISVAADSLAKNPPWYALRTIGFAELLRPLATRLRVPLAETFQAIWGKGGSTLEEAARNMWPLYPLVAFGKPFSTLLEAEGKGDTIHPNVLGHLQIAKAVFQAIAGTSSAAPLAFEAKSFWTEQGPASSITVKNVSGMRRKGRLAVYPLMDGESPEMKGKGDYSLAPGEVKKFTVIWPQVKRPEDLLRESAIRYLAPGYPLIPVVDYAKSGCRVYGVIAPFSFPTSFVRERQTVTGNKVQVTLQVGDTWKKVTVVLPDDAEVGRIPLIERVQEGERWGWAVAELAYVRYGQARSGEATVDGDLSEWEGHLWSNVGDPCQARYSNGPNDNRSNPSECYIRWAFKAGEKGVFLAAKATGKGQKDRFLLFFDPRPPQFLGSVGRYYWASGLFDASGTVRLEKGETSKTATGMKGLWKPSTEGATLELFLPYELMEQTTWPSSGDLGVSIWWIHPRVDGRTDLPSEKMQTNLMWSEDGHPWNPRWYGVVRRNNQSETNLPYMVRIK